MTEPRIITAADIDAQGNVTIWDHGPQEPKDLAPDDPRYQAAVADAKAWHEANGRGPVPMSTHSSNAAHSMQVEPERYALDPIDLDDPEVEAEADRIGEERAAAKATAEERAAAILRAADLKAAAVTVLARRQAEAAEKPAPAPALVPRIETGAQIAARLNDKSEPE